MSIYPGNGVSIRVEFTYDEPGLILITASDIVLIAGTPVTLVSDDEGCEGVAVGCQQLDQRPGGVLVPDVRNAQLREAIRGTRFRLDDPCIGELESNAFDCRGVRFEGVLVRNGPAFSVALQLGVPLRIANIHERNFVNAVEQRREKFAAGDFSLRRFGLGYCPGKQHDHNGQTQ